MGGGGVCVCGGGDTAGHGHDVRSSYGPLLRSISVRN